MKYSRLFVFAFCCVVGAADVQAHDTSSSHTMIVDKCRPELFRKVWMSIDADAFGIPAGMDFALTVTDKPKTIDGQDYGDWTLFSPDPSTQPISLLGTCVELPQPSGPKVKEYVLFAARSGSSDTKLRLYVIVPHREHMNDVDCKTGHKKLQSCKAALKSNISNFLKIFDLEIDLAPLSITHQSASKPGFVISQIKTMDIGAGHAHGTD